MREPARAVFNTLHYAKQLLLVGFTQEQAEVQAEALSSLVEEHLVSKQDVKKSEVALRHDITLVQRDIKEMEMALRHDMALMQRDIKAMEVAMKAMEASLQKEMKAMEVSLTKDIKAMGRDLKIWLGSSLALAVSVLGGFVGYLSHIH